MKKHKGAKAPKSSAAMIFSSVALSLASLIVTALLFGGILMTFKNPVGYLKIASLAVFMVCAAASGFINSRRNGPRGTLISVFSSLIFILILFSSSLVMTRGHIPGVLFMNYACYILVSLFFSFMAHGRRRSRGRR